MTPAPELVAQTRAGALARARERLAACGVDDPVADARHLLLHAAGLRASDLVLAPEAALTATALRRFESFIERRASREPVSRIVGARGFWTLDLEVSPRVLDPRADTETLIELALDLLGERRSEFLRILDLGSGSGAILCALLDACPRAFGAAVDLSAEACAATARNLARCGLAERGATLRADWGRALAGRFDLIASNPPYIPVSELDGLDPEVARHDPRLALSGGEDGLDCYRAILEETPRLLAAGGTLVLEVGAGQAKPVERLIEDRGLVLRGAKRDLGGHWRALAAGLA